MTEIRFLVIGAEKGGTTSLFEYLRRHPEIHMPAEKELSYFSLDRNFNRGWSWYLDTALRNAPKDAVCGEASVGYMMGTPFRQLAEDEHIEMNASKEMEPLENVIPERIKDSLPDVRLLCVLRDPVERAYSHYRMARLNNAESRPFDEVVEHLLEPDALDQSRTVRTLTNGYIANGEYARILLGYFRIFQPEQIMTIFSDDLANRATETVAQAFEFVGVSPQFIPDNIDAKYRAGAVKQRSAIFDLYAWQTNLGKIRQARALWHLLPDRVRYFISTKVNIASYRLALWNRQQSSAEEPVSAATRERLIRHFQPDGEALTDLIKTEPPWLSRWSSS
jgi:Sulfotransferase domain